MPISFYVPASSAAVSGVRGTLSLQGTGLELLVAGGSACSLPLDRISATAYHRNLFSSELILTVTSAPRECLEYMEQDRLRLRFCRTQSGKVQALAAQLQSVET